MPSSAKSALAFLTVPGIILVAAIVVFFVVRNLGEETRLFDGLLFLSVLIGWLLCFVLGRNKQI